MSGVHEQVLRRVIYHLLKRLALAVVALAFAVGICMIGTLLLGGLIEWAGARVFEAGVF